MKTLKTIGIVLICLIISCVKEKQQVLTKVVIPTILTQDITEITKISAKVGSEITSNGGSTILSRGVCWSTSPNPTIDNLKTIDTLIIGKSISFLSGLTYNQKYYVRAYAINSSGISYGEEKNFITNDLILPKLEIDSSLLARNHYAITIGNVSQLGDEPILKVGVCWATHSNVTVKDTLNYISYPNAKGFYVEIYGLNVATKYYFKLFAFTASDTTYSLEREFTTTNDPNEQPIALKPNIYIYPKINSQLNVQLLFPKGGNVTKSIPEYGNGWNVSVEPSGLIDKTYTYLFYESKQPDVWQKTSAWVIKKSDLKAFFEKNMADYGFKNNEITDFTDFWIPRLTQFEYYALYPQETKLISSVISLQISEQPENLLRLFYDIKGYYSKPNQTIQEPIIDKSFTRTGYFVTEWGVILR
jgi:hypothetical protein